MAKTTRYAGKGGIVVGVNFEPLIEKIRQAEGDVEEAVWKAARVGGKVMKDELVAQCNASGVPASVTNAITFQAERSAGGARVGVKVGWRMGDYDPKNLSAGYKAVFLNYGTPHRYTKTTHPIFLNGRWVTPSNDKGYIDGRGFIGRAKKKARPKIKKAQQEALEAILEGLKK